MAFVDAATNPLYVYHHDATGHTVAITDANQNIVNRYAYSAYGKVLAENELISQPFTYVGRYGVMREADNLYYMRARYYDAELGRFISEDPIGFAGGINVYAYVGGNPMMLVDPSGLSADRGARKGGGSVTGGKIMAGAILVSGGLLADDVTGVGIADDVAIPFILAGGAIVAGAVGTWNVLTERPDGAWPADKGAREWDKRKGGGRKGRDKFHDTKQNSPWPGGKEEWSVDPSTGEIYDPNGDPNGDPYDNLND